MDSKLLKGNALKKKLYEDAIDYYRQHADEFIEDVMEIRLNLYQKIMVRAFFKYSFLVWVMCRGTGKTWLGVLCIVTYGLLYPNSKIGIIAPSFRQAKNALQEKYKDELCSMSPFLEQEEKNFSCSVQKARVEFYNGSWIEAYPLGNDGAKIRGARLHVTLIDEAAYVNREIIDKVVTPMLIVKSGYRVGKEQEDYSGNKILMVSTASYRFNHLYNTFRSWTMEMIKPDNKKYFTMTLPYTVGVRAGLFDESIVEKAKRDMSEMEFSMEYLGIFPRLNENSWIKYDDLIKCSDLTKIECNGVSNFEYVMSIDVARMEGEDNTVIMVFKLRWAKDHVDADLVYIRALNGMTFTEQAANVREVLRKFPNIIRIFQDTMTIGQGLTDELAKDYYYEPEDKWYPPLIDMNDEVAMNNRDKTHAVPIIYGIKASPELNHRMGYAVKNYTEKGWLHMYPYSIEEDRDLTLEEQLLVQQSEATRMEVMNIETKGVYAGWVQFFTKSKRKDRWSALGMGLYGIDLIRKEREDDDETGEVLCAVSRR